MIITDYKTMHLKTTQREILKNISEEYTQMYKCKKCDGTGLMGHQKNSFGGYSWSGEFCDACDGIGYIDWLSNITRNTK